MFDLIKENLNEENLNENNIHKDYVQWETSAWGNTMYNARAAQPNELLVWRTDGVSRNLAHGGRAQMPILSFHSFISN